jgi:hypothetical protein
VKIAIGFVLILVIAAVMTALRLRKEARTRREAARANGDQLVNLLEGICAKKDALHAARNRSQVFGQHRRYRQ